MRRFIIGLSLLVAFGISSANAQDNPNVQLGLRPFQAYSGGDIDSINLYNGGMNLDIPLVSYPQQGGKLNLGITLHYMNIGYFAWETCWAEGYYEECSGSAGSEHGFQVFDGDMLTPGGSGTPQLNNQSQPVAWAMTGSVAEPNGSAHQAYLTSSTPTATYVEAIDTSGFQEYFPGNPNSGQSFWSPVAIGPDGTQYAMNNNTDVWTRTDANGNQISYSFTSGWTDTLGRKIPPFTLEGVAADGIYNLLAAQGTSTSSSGCSGPLPTVAAYTWTPPGPNGGTYPLKFCFAAVADFTSSNDPSPTGTYNELQSIVLPDNSTWTFQYSSDLYDGYSFGANLSQVTFPTGGTLSYTWNATATPILGPGCPAVAPGAVYQILDAIATRTFNPNDGISPASTWSYSYVTATSTTPQQTIVSAPPSVGSTPDVTVHTFGLGQCDGDLETQTQYYQGSNTGGTLLKTVNTQYRYNYLNPGSQKSEPELNPPINVVPAQTTTTWANGQENGTVYTYDSSLNVYTGEVAVAGGKYNTWTPIVGPNTYARLLTKTDYDYGSGSLGAPLRTTTTNYLAFGNSAYLAANLLDPASSVQVAGAGPGSYTNYGYDGSGGPSGIHGNLTSTSRWLNTTGTYLTSTNVYNTNGLMTSSTDPKRNVTTYAYTSPCYAGTGPTAVTNAASQTTTNCYDSNTGLLTSTTDPNKQTTNYQYDGASRTTQINNPDGGQISFNYPSANQVNITETINSSTNRLTYLLVDGMGRKIRQAVTNGETTPYDEADTCYDSFGRIIFQSYPFQDSGPFATARSCGSSEAGDSSAYDALGRNTKVTHSDGSVVSLAYSGNSTTVTDEQSKTREAFLDGLGRLSEVIENPGGLNYTTTYTHDVLDDLTGVTQAGSRQRTFVYDSLARLINSTNPETNASGTATIYGYDADGNLTTKTDARGITTCFGVWSGTTCNGTNGYDALNRPLEKTYSDGTPSVNYYYEYTSIWGIPLTNTIGRLSATNSWNSVTNSWVSGEVFSYDSMGRVVNNSQCTHQNCAVSPYYFPVSYTYDLLGDITSSTNSAVVTLTSSYNAGARLTSMTSSLSDSNHPGTLVSSVHYNAAGDLTTAMLGNGLIQSAAYNPRLQPCLLSIAGQVPSPLNCSGDTPPQNVLTQRLQYFTGNNGDVQQYSATGAQNFDRTYSYDQLNRLSAMSAPGDACSGLSWTYDAWGNRPSQTATGGTCYQPQYTATANNQLASPYQYDAAGNMIYDGVHQYTYDAENRLGTVDSGSTASYVYDAEGRRVQKTVGSTTTNYVYDIKGRVMSEYGNCQGCLNVAYTYLNGGMAAIYQGGTTDFAHSDHLGSTRLLTGYPTANVLECDDYYPFGELISCGTTTGTTHKFTGKERDPESNVDNFSARYRSSSLGRFMSPDPLGDLVADPTNPQSWNLYSYVLNNPLNLVDPTGLYCEYYANDFGNESDVEEVDAESSPDECAGTGGQWFENQTTITVNGNTGDVTCGGLCAPPVVQPMTYAECVKEGGNFFSLQNGLSYISGGRLGNGWLSSALLGNSISGGIGFFQSLGQGNGGQATNTAVGEAVSRGGGPAAVAVAATVPNLQVSVAGAAGVSIETPTMSASTSIAGELEAMIPTGTLARLGAGALNATLKTVGQVKDPIDITASSFAGVVCSIGR